MPVIGPPLTGGSLLVKLAPGMIAIATEASGTGTPEAGATREKLCEMCDACLLPWRTRSGRTTSWHALPEAKGERVVKGGMM